MKKFVLGSLVGIGVTVFALSLVRSLDPRLFSASLGTLIKMSVFVVFGFGLLFRSVHKTKTGRRRWST